MKGRALGIFAIFMLTACQLPLVEIRNVRYEVAFDVDGRTVTTKSDFTCHFEDVTWISTRGKSWNVRDGANAARILGELPDGTYVWVNDEMAFKRAIYLWNPNQEKSSASTRHVLNHPITEYGYWSRS